MASKLFDYDNPFFMLMARVWDLMILNFLAVLFCLPVVTAGASVTALYYVTLKMAEDRESHIYRSFLKAFKDNFIQSTAIHIILWLVGAVLVIDFWYVVLGGTGISVNPANGLAGSGAALSGIFSTGNPVRLAMAVIFLALFVMYMFTLLYVYAVQARFINPVPRTIGNAFMMAVRHLPSTVLMVLLNAAFFYIAVNYISWLAFWALSGPLYLNSVLLCRVFKRYMV